MIWPCVGPLSISGPQMGSLPKPCRLAIHKHIKKRVVKKEKNEQILLVFWHFGEISWFSTTQSLELLAKVILRAQPCKHNLQMGTLRNFTKNLLRYRRPRNKHIKVCCGIKYDATKFLSFFGVCCSAKNFMSVCELKIGMLMGCREMYGLRGVKPR